MIVVSTVAAMLRKTVTLAKPTDEEIEFLSNLTELTTGTVTGLGKNSTSIVFAPGEVKRSTIETNYVSHIPYYLSIASLSSKMVTIHVNDFLPGVFDEIREGFMRNTAKYYSCIVQVHSATEATLQVKGRVIAVPLRVYDFPLASIKVILYGEDEFNKHLITKTLCKFAPVIIETSSLANGVACITGLYGTDGEFDFLRPKTVSTSFEFRSSDYLAKKLNNFSLLSNYGAEYLPFLCYHGGEYPIQADTKKIEKTFNIFFEDRDCLKKIISIDDV